MKRFISLFILLAGIAVICCGCGSSSGSSGTSKPKETEPPKYADTKITVNYDSSFGELLFGNSEVFEISLDGEKIGTIAFKDDKPLKVSRRLTEGTHTLSAKGSEDSIFDFNTVSFKVKYTDGTFYAEFEMDNGSLELIETRIEVLPEKTAVSTNADGEAVTEDTQNMVKVRVYVSGSLSFISDILTSEYQPFTVYVDGDEIGHMSKGGDCVDENIYFSRGTHKVSIRKNNTDTFDTDSKTFIVTDLTKEVQFNIKHNHLTNTYELEPIE